MNMLFDGASENLRLEAMPSLHPPLPLFRPLPSPSQLHEAGRDVPSLGPAQAMRPLHGDDSAHDRDARHEGARYLSAASTHSSPCASKHRMGRGLPYSPAPLHGGSDATFAFVTTARGISLDFAEAKSAQGQSIGRSIHCGTHPNNGR
jgi:hypothetical protein